MLLTLFATRILEDLTVWLGSRMPRQSHVEAVTFKCVIKSGMKGGVPRATSLDQKSVAIWGFSAHPQKRVSGFTCHQCAHSLLLLPRTALLGVHPRHLVNVLRALEEYRWQGKRWLSYSEYVLFLPRI